MNKNIATLLLIGILGATTVACKKEEPSAVEKLEENVKDGLDMREHEKLKDAGESASDAIKEAGEAAKEAVTPEDKPK
jgi:hypothetical protein